MSGLEEALLVFSRGEIRILFPPRLTMTRRSGERERLKADPQRLDRGEEEGVNKVKKTVWIVPDVRERCRYSVPMGREGIRLSRSRYS